MTQKLIFGNEVAESDDLLYDCAVQEQVSDKPIVSGRWGTGKTAILLLSHLPLTSTLRDQHAPDELAWYLREGALDLQALLALRRDHASGERVLIRALEDVWAAEIIRKACLVLRDLWSHYGSPPGEHWRPVLEVDRTGRLGRSLWKRLPELFSLLFGKPERAVAATGLRDELGYLFREEAFANLQKCLSDVRGKTPVPAVAVEPIDSPAGQIDAHPGLAQPLVSALLNVFERSFQPSGSQLLTVRLSVPWHRYDPGGLDAPQKLAQYIAWVTWDELSLRKFINRRIEWEFKRVGRHVQHPDPWSMLFAGTVKDDRCNKVVAEDSFDFVLRHTHYRARDVQRLARLCVDVCAHRKGVSGDEVLLGRKTTQIGEELILETVRSGCHLMTKELITEGARRFEFLPALMQTLRGMPVPFSSEELKKRVSKVCEFNAAASALWEVGIVGISIAADNLAKIGTVRSILGLQGHRQHQTNGKTVHTWSLFSHNWSSDFLATMDRFRADERVSAQLVLHPKTFDYLMAKVGSDWPLGS